MLLFRQSSRELRVSFHKNKMRKVIKSLRKFPKLALFVTAFAVLGVLVLIISRAATPYASLEAENGVRTPQAQLSADVNASGGNAVRFGGASTSTGYKVQGRFLYDPCGQKVIIRGPENFTASYGEMSAFISEVSKTGANTFRQLHLNYRPGAPNPSLAEIESLINQTLANKMIPDIGVGSNKPDDYLDPPLKALLQKYQDKILLHTMGEGTQASENEWASEGKAGIAKLRAAGYTGPLYILSNHFGRNLPTLLNKAPEVLASDPLQNIIFGWQAYWGGPDNYYQNLYGMSLHEAMQKVRDAPFMVQVGISYQTDFPGPNDSFEPQFMDYVLAMQDAQAYEIGWLWWDWKFGGPGVDLTTNGTYGGWQAPFGREVAIDNIGSLSKTVRTPYISTGTCQ